MSSNKYVLTAPRKSPNNGQENPPHENNFLFLVESLMLTVVCVWEKVSSTTTLSEEIAWTYSCLALFFANNGAQIEHLYK